MQIILCKTKKSSHEIISNFKHNNNQYMCIKIEPPKNLDGEITKILNFELNISSFTSYLPLQS